MIVIQGTAPTAWVEHDRRGRPRDAARPDGYRRLMKIMRAVSAVGLAKTVYDQLRKPENQARIRSAIAKARRR